MGNFKVVQYLKRSFSAKQSRQQRYNKANMSSTLIAEKVPISSTFADSPANSEIPVRRSENDEGEVTKTLYNFVSGKVNERSPDSEKSRPCDILSGEENVVGPTQHRCEQGSIHNHGEASHTKTGRPCLWINTRRQGRQDICIGESGTYEYVEDSMSSNSSYLTMEKLTTHRHGKGPSLFEKFHWLDLESSKQDTFCARSKDESNDLLTTQYILDAVAGPYREASASTGDELHHPSVGDCNRSETFQVSQEYSSCSLRQSMVTLEAADEEFGWIPIGYDSSTNGEEENERD